ncbi:MAG: hypothetical protein R3B82_05160 [Sandaracinaceae bacterium]
MSGGTVDGAPKAGAAVRGRGERARGRRGAGLGARHQRHRLAARGLEAERAEDVLADAGRVGPGALEAAVTSGARLADDRGEEVHRAGVGVAHTLGETHGALGDHLMALVGSSLAIFSALMKSISRMRGRRSREDANRRAGASRAPREPSSGAAGVAAARFAMWP